MDSFQQGEQVPEGRPKFMGPVRIGAVTPENRARKRLASRSCLTLLIGCAAIFCIAPSGRHDEAQNTNRLNAPNRREPEITAVNAADFEVTGTRIWSAPAPGAETTIDLGLRITNRSNRAVRFNRLDTVSMTLSDPDGAVLRMDGGRNAPRAAETVSNLLAPGESLVIERSAKLLWLPDGSALRLIGSDGFGGVWYFDGLRRTTWEFRIAYENLRAQIGSRTSVWTGKAVTRARVELR